MQNIAHKKPGYIALTAVLILGAISVILVSSLTLVGVDSLRGGNERLLSESAKFYADACVEQALYEISESTPYTGTASLTFTDGNCSYMVTSQGGQNRRVEAVGISGIYTSRKLIIIDTLLPQINIVSWKEVAAF